MGAKFMKHDSSPDGKPAKARKRQFQRPLVGLFIAISVLTIVGGGVTWWFVTQQNSQNNAVADEADRAIAARLGIMRQKGYTPARDDYMELGDLYTAKNDFVRAEESYLQAEKLQPQNSETLEALAATYRRQHNKEKCLLYYKKLINAVSDPNSVHHNLLPTYQKEQRAIEQNDFEFKTISSYIEGMPI